MVKKIIFLGLLLVFLAAMVFAQEKIEAPVWNVGDKWAFTGNGNVEVVSSWLFSEIFRREMCIRKPGCDKYIQNSRLEPDQCSRGR